MEYACFTFDLMPSSSKKRLEAVHNKALRAIYKKDRLFGTKDLLELASETNKETRLTQLKKRNLDKAFKTKNPLICQISNEYKKFKGGRILGVRTLFCNYDHTPPVGIASDSRATIPRHKIIKFLSLSHLN